MAIETAIVALATLAGSLGGIWLAQRGERDRRRLDHAHGLRVALVKDRIAAYQELISALRSLEDAQEEMALRVDVSHSRDEGLDDVSEQEKEEIFRDIDKRLKQAEESMSDASERSRRLLDRIELSASTPVASAARELCGLTEHLWEARREHLWSFWDEEATAEEAAKRTAEAVKNLEVEQAQVASARHALRRAVRCESRFDD